MLSVENHGDRHMTLFCIEGAIMRRCFKYFNYFLILLKKMNFFVSIIRILHIKKLLILINNSWYQSDFFLYQKIISWYLSCRNLSVTSCPLQTDSSGSSPVPSRHFVSNPHMNEKNFKDKTKMVNLISYEYDQNYQEHFKNNEFSYILHSPLTPSLAVSNQVQL